MDRYCGLKGLSRFIRMSYTYEQFMLWDEWLFERRN